MVAGAQGLVGSALLLLAQFYVAQDDRECCTTILNRARELGQGEGIDELEGK